jgi:hypothetical protein
MRIQIINKVVPLKGWDFKKVIKGEFYPWDNEFLELPIHDSTLYIS